MNNSKPSSSRMSGLLQIIERSTGAGLDDKNVECVSQATGKILRMLGQQDRSLTESIIRKSKVSQALISLLLSTQDVALHLNTIHILELVAGSSSSKCTRLVRQGAPHALLRSVAATSRVRPLLEELTLHQHLLLLKLAHKEKKLALKARLCGVVTVTLDLAKQCLSNMDLISPILQVLRIYASNSNNSISLVKNGLLNLVDRLLSLYGKQNCAVFRFTLELFQQVLSVKSNSSKASSAGATKRMLELYVYWTDLDKNHKYVSLRKSILSCLKHMVGSETGRRALLKADGISILYTSAKQSDDTRQEYSRTFPSFLSNPHEFYRNEPSSPNGKAIDNLALTCSQIIRKSMPKQCLPVPSLHGPVYFDENPESYLNVLAEEDEEQEEECVVPLTLTNVEHFVRFCPEISLAQSTRQILETLAEYKREVQCLVPLTPSNSHNDLSDERSENGHGGISVIVKPARNGTTQQLDNDTRKSNGHSGLEASVSNMTIDDTFLRNDYQPPPAKATKHFVKVAVPDMYSHRPPHYLEQLYDPIPSVQRTLMLLDIARAVHPETLINRVAYDQDALVRDQRGVSPALSLLKWDNSLGRAKILPSVPQSPPSIDSPGEQVTQHAHHSSVNIPVLQFESRFECGNLRKALQVRIFEYDLVLNSDIGSSRHHQWFYFEVKNMVAEFPYRFNIVNCEKSFSSFTQGMQPLLYSSHEALTNGSGWHRTGKRICYYKNNFIRRAADEGAGGKAGPAQSLYTLTFTICFPHTQDTCYIAYHYPYSYSTLQSHLLEVAHLPGIHSRLRRQTLCHSLAGNAVDLLTITEFPGAGRGTGGTPLQDRDYIFLTARVHPGESNSSWIMRGVINFLLSNTEKAHQLRNKFVFKIVPMLNPDGVINGSHRCSLLGVDMNRNWTAPSPSSFPSLYHTKGVIQLLVAMGKRPLLFCDFHGHSRKKNVFMYGNITAPCDNATVKLLPTILDIHAPAFSFSSCCFSVEKSRESTARVALWRQFGIARCYTLESTYCGADQGLYKGCQIGTHHLEEMGAKFCEGLLIMGSADEPCCLEEDSEDESSYFSSEEESEEEDDSSA